MMNVCILVDEFFYFDYMFIDIKVQVVCIVCVLKVDYFVKVVVLFFDLLNVLVFLEEVEW